jgi:hypothetical protein
VPLGPELDFSAAHDREHLPARRPQPGRTASAA